MTVHTIRAVQRIPAPLDQVWDYFSDATNLHSITPANMNFRIISRYHGDELYAGQIIEYRVSPLLGIPLYWLSEITHVRAKEFFADDQRQGPYQMWQHQHFFKAIDGGTEMIDLIHYKNPLGFLGRWANAWFIRKKLRSIFEYRFVKIEEIFGKWQNGEHADIRIS